MADEQLKALGADMFALKQLLPSLLSRVGQLDPILASAIERGFDDATQQIEHLAAASRSTETQERCTNALASIRRLRAAAHIEFTSPSINPSHS
jgi:hypothetical protein